MTVDYEIVSSQAKNNEEIYSFITEAQHVCLNSNYSPKREMERFLSKYAGKKFYIIIGIGNGSILKTWKSLNKDYNFLFIIEPYKEISLDPELKEFIKKEKDIYFQYYKDFNPLILTEIIQRNIGIDTEIIIHPNYERTDVAYLKEISVHLAKSVKIAHMNKNTEQLFRKQWIIEPLLNLEYTMGLAHIDELKDRFVGETAFLIASGPSLKEQIPFIKMNQENAYIFAAGSSFNGLISNNIIPDFVTSIDAGQVNYDVHFKDSKYNGHLIVAGTVQSDILKNHKGPASIAQISIDNVTQKMLPGFKVFPSVPSVTVFTLQLLYFMGFSNVYLIGQDLALNKQNEYYSKGVKSMPQVEGRTPDLFVESNSGETVGTLYQLYSHLESFNNLLEFFDTEKMKVYNLSRNGAKIKKAPYVPFEHIELIKRTEVKFNKTKVRRTVEGLNAVKSIMDDFVLLNDMVNKFEKTMQKLNFNSISDNDLKKILKQFKKIRQIDIVEKIITPQLSFLIQRINNIFEISLNKSSFSLEDKRNIVSEIRKLIVNIRVIVQEVINDNRIKLVENEQLL
jgi:hypothetical protein